MDREPNSARVPFDMRLHLAPFAKPSYTADHYHAMKRLVSEGYVTIKPDAKLKLGPSGLWEVEGQPPLAETTSREESPVEPYISAKTVKPRTSFGPNSSHDSRNPDSVAEGETGEMLRLMNGVKEILKEKHVHAHPAWTKLEDELEERSIPDKWTEEILKRAILEAHDEEFADWNAFSESYAYCMGSCPNYRRMAPVNTLMRALLHSYGCPEDDAYFLLESVHGSDEGDVLMEEKKLDELKRVAQTRDPLNVTTITHYVELVQISRDISHDRKSILTLMEELYGRLEAMIKDKMLGHHMLQLIGL